MPTAHGIISGQSKTGAGPQTRKAREIVRPIIESGLPLGDPEPIAKNNGLSERSIERAFDWERGRLEGLQEAAAIAPIDPATLPKTVQGQLAVFERRLRAQIEADFELRVREEVRRRLDQRDEKDTELVEQANQLILHQTGRNRPPFTPQEYYTLLWALHPDSNDPAKATAAFVMIRQKKLLLCDDGPIKRKSDDAKPLPKTAEDLIRMKQARKATAR